MSDIEDVKKAANDVVDNVKEFFRGFIRKHWYLLILLAIGLAGAFIGIILVILTFINNTGTSLGPIATWHFNDFSVGAIVLICLLLIAWNLLLVILPTIGYFGIIAGIFWWVILSANDKATLKVWMKRGDRKEHRKKRMKRGGGGGFSLFINIIFLLVVLAQGNWWTHFEFLPISYFVIIYLWIFIALAIIAAVTGVVFLTLFLTGKIWKQKQS
jgi:hypothetical protein